jgi:hypothetical protein
MELPISARRLAEQAERLEGVQKTKVCEPIEGYDERVGDEYDEVHIHGVEIAHGPMFAFLSEVGWYPTAVVTGDTRTVRIVARDEPPEETCSASDAWPDERITDASEYVEAWEAAQE